MDESDTGIYAREIDGFATVQLGIASGRVISLSVPAEFPEEATRDHDLLDRIERYVSGEIDDFADVPIALTVPTDHRAVVEEVRKIPYGETSDVAALARRAGLDPEEEIDTVRAALEANPIPILLPDHRIGDGPSSIPPDLARRLRSIEQ